MNNDPNMSAAIAEAMRAVAGPDSVIENEVWGTGSTDMGDVSAIMPAVHPHASGAAGIGHGSDYRIADKELACLKPAQCLVVTADMLLREDAALGKDIISKAKPIFQSKEEYLAAIDKLNMKKEAVVYNEDGTVTLDYSK